MDACEYCHGPMTPKPSHNKGGLPKKYCSTQCGQNAVRAKDPKKARQRDNEYWDNHPEELKEKNHRDYVNHREARLLAQWKYDIKRDYGISVEEYNLMLAAQSGLCAVCKTDKPGRGHNRFCIDHKHFPDEVWKMMSLMERRKWVRGLLCHGCNNGNGITDDPTLLRAKANYLELPPIFGVEQASSISKVA